MTKETKELDCEGCMGTGNANSSMRSPYPHRKILYSECPACKGTGKKAQGS
jgi:DnaJ-class molecular chaperone